MIKRILISLGLSVVLTVTLFAILILTREYSLDRLVHLIMKMRGTANYEGEDKGTEVWNIIMGMIMPIIFLLALAVVVFFNRKRYGRRR